MISKITKSCQKVKQIYQIGNFKLHTESQGQQLNRTQQDEILGNQLKQRNNTGYFEKQAEDLDYLVEKIYPMLREYIIENDKIDTKVIEYENPQVLGQKFNITLPRQGQTLDDVVDGVSQTLKYSVRTGNPRFFNQLYAGSKPAGQIGEFVTGVLNTAVHTYAVAPVLAMMEVECARATAEAFGFDTDQSDGLLVPGGTFANITAFMMARHKYFEHVRLEGYKPEDKPIAFCSHQAHYSIKRAAMMAGMGMNAVQTVNCNLNGDIIPEALDAALTQAKQNGQKPFFVNTTAGTTVMGGYDNFEEISKVCKKHDVWMHIDGCWGGAAIFSQKHKHLLNGSDKADSVSLNFHKWLSVPLQNSILVTNNHKGLFQKSNASGAVYLFHKHEASDYDLGDKSLQCGRRSDSLKLWLSWKKEGNEGFGAQVDEAFESASYFKNQLQNRENFHLIADPMCTNVCFFYVPKAFRKYKDISEIYDKLNSVTPLIYKKMQRAGNMLVNYNPLLDKGLPYFFRIILIQRNLTKEHLDFVLEEFERLGEEITEQEVQEQMNYMNQ